MNPEHPLTPSPRSSFPLSPPPRPWRLTLTSLPQHLLTRSLGLWATTCLVLSVILLTIEGVEAQRLLKAGLPLRQLLGLLLPDVLAVVLVAACALVGLLLPFSLAQRGELLGLMSLGKSPAQVLWPVVLVVGGVSAGLHAWTAVTLAPEATRVLSRWREQAGGDPPGQKIPAWQETDTGLWQAQADPSPLCVQHVEAIQLQQGQVQAVLRMARLCQEPAKDLTHGATTGPPTPPTWRGWQGARWQLQPSPAYQPWPDGPLEQTLVSQLPGSWRPLNARPGSVPPLLPEAGLLGALLCPLLLLLAMPGAALRPRQGSFFRALGRSLWPCGACLGSLWLLHTSLAMARLELAGWELAWLELAWLGLTGLLASWRFLRMT